MIILERQRIDGHLFKLDWRSLWQIALGSRDHFRVEVNANTLTKMSCQLDELFTATSTHIQYTISRFQVSGDNFQIIPRHRVAINLHPRKIPALTLTDRLRDLLKFFKCHRQYTLVKMFVYKFTLGLLANQFPTLHQPA